MFAQAVLAIKSWSPAHAPYPVPFPCSDLIVLANVPFQQCSKPGMLANAMGGAHTRRLLWMLSKIFHWQPLRPAWIFDLHGNAEKESQVQH